MQQQQTTEPNGSPRGADRSSPLNGLDPRLFYEAFLRLGNLAYFAHSLLPERQGERSDGTLRVHSQHVEGGDRRTRATEALARLRGVAVLLAAQLAADARDRLRNYGAVYLDRLRQANLALGAAYGEENYSLNAQLHRKHDEAAKLSPGDVRTVTQLEAEGTRCSDCGDLIVWEEDQDPSSLIGDQVARCCSRIYCLTPAVVVVECEEVGNEI